MRLGGPGFDEFVDAELPRLLRLGHLLTGSPHDAWDLTQETLARVGTAWSRIHSEGNPGGYAHKTLVRLHISRWRRLRRELLGISTDPLADRGGDELAAADLRPALAEALAQLGTSQRTAVVLRYYADLTVAEVASQMGCSLGNAKSQISRALRRLEEVLDQDPRLDDQATTSIRSPRAPTTGNQTSPGEPR
jgi:RNA polymerase sigma-70 factor (sigma-E family)